jgi:hypothetical protein
MSSNAVKLKKKSYFLSCNKQLTSFLDAHLADGLTVPGTKGDKLRRETNKRSLTLAADDAMLTNSPCCPLIIFKVSLKTE